VLCLSYLVVLNLRPHYFFFTILGPNAELFLHQEEFDTYDHNIHIFVQLQFLRKRSKIIEIVAAKDIIFALAQSGLCAAFSRSKYLVSSYSSFFLFSPNRLDILPCYASNFAMVSCDLHA
jgi:hypothetical protein